MIYLDFNATTPIAKEVADEMRPFLDEYFGNPSSSHAFGVKTKLAVEQARQRIADLINCDTSEIIFTSGGTESNNYAIKGFAHENKHKGNHIISTAIEHPAVFEVCEYLAKHGFQITYLPVDEFGRVSVDDFKKAIKPNTILASVMHANNEVGTIQPIAELVSIAHEHGIAFHCDAAQSIGKTEVDVKKMGVDLLSIAGHKLYAPKGIGALYIKSGTKLEKLIHGADHEQNLRAGTENVLEIVGLGKAAELAKEHLLENQKDYAEKRDLLYNLLLKELTDIKLNGHPEYRLPNTLSVSFPGVEANTLISRLENVAASAGAACHSESVDLSAVLEAMKIPVEIAMGTIRFSTGRGLSTNDIESAAAEIIEKVKQLSPRSGEEKNIVKSKEIKLTHYTHGLGCACKIEPQKLEAILKKIEPFPAVNVMVGTETSDDATVYKLNDEQALVQTLDFFTPIVDDPYNFGAIAAANALSDVYAMGAKPLFALNIVGFPDDTLPMEVLEQILKGARDKAAEAGIPVLGGHTIEDPEPKFGMVVSGILHPDKVIKNHGALAGDALILTKPLGTGILSTAMKRGMLGDEKIEEVSQLMMQLNKIAAETMLNFNVHACTDVTGFGLPGHLKEMIEASQVSAKINFNSLPFIDGVKQMAIAGVIPGGTFNNMEYVSSVCDFGKLDRTSKLMFCDAQTSGGLLIAIPKNEAEELLSKLKDNGLGDSTIIGEIIENEEYKIFVNN